eukprot:759497-Hanusia_phi.AAC.1
MAASTPTRSIRILDDFSFYRSQAPPRIRSHRILPPSAAQMNVTRPLEAGERVRKSPDMVFESIMRARSKVSRAGSNYNFKLFVFQGFDLGTGAERTADPVFRVSSGCGAISSNPDRYLDVNEQKHGTLSFSLFYGSESDHNDKSDSPYAHQAHAHEHSHRGTPMIASAAASEEEPPRRSAPLSDPLLLSPNYLPLI